MSIEQEIKVRVKKVLGVAQPFWQGSSLRLTIPRRVTDEYKLKWKVGKEFFAFIFFETDRGILLLPFDKVPNPPNVRDALQFIDLSKISDEELEALLEEEE
ncbi:MAG: hypothetical protein ACUVTD_05245 [Nitrososphaerales archaeon]